jgi:hypothetical protein
MPLDAPVTTAIVISTKECYDSSDTVHRMEVEQFRSIRKVKMSSILHEENSRPRSNPASGPVQVFHILHVAVQ